MEQVQKFFIDNPDNGVTPTSEEQLDHQDPNTVANGVWVVLKEDYDQLFAAYLALGGE
jgi:hypothetical protein